MTNEEQRLAEARERKVHWKRWGPYLSERAWGTVREDYSEQGTAWDYLPHDHARSRAYRWNESLQKFHHYLGDAFRVELPAGSGRDANLDEVAAELSRRLTRIFLRDGDGRRPCHGRDALYRDDPHFRELVLFHEYFHGDDGSGVGASHQTGWTGLVAKLLQQSGE
jgi:hypothetical protein